jgi:hypothetical protein
VLALVSTSLQTSVAKILWTRSSRTDKGVNLCHNSLFIFSLFVVKVQYFVALVLHLLKSSLTLAVPGAFSVYSNLHEDGSSRDGLGE